MKFTINLTAYVPMSMSYDVEADDVDSAVKKAADNMKEEDITDLHGNNVEILDDDIVIDNVEKVK